MADIVLAIHAEMKRRNPIGINFYAPVVKTAASLLDEVAKGESENFTSEAGPKEPKTVKSATRHFTELVDELAFFDKVTAKVRRKKKKK